MFKILKYSLKIFILILLIQILVYYKVLLTEI